MLHDIWFLLIAALWIGYFVLEGFDFGLGILLPFLGHNDQERRAPGAGLESLKRGCSDLDPHATAQHNGVATFSA